MWETAIVSLWSTMLAVLREKEEQAHQQQGDEFWQTYTESTV
jgi:hypothetical protein